MLRAHQSSILYYHSLESPSRERRYRSRKSFLRLSVSIVKGLPSNILGGRETDHGDDRWSHVRDFSICILSWCPKHRRLHERNLGRRFGTSWLPSGLPY